jgi:hypothetical protein
MQEYQLNHTKAIVTISTIEGYHPGENVSGLELNKFCEILQDIEENKFADTSISWLVKTGKTVYKQKWGCPFAGEDVFILEADYTEYDKGTDIHDWKHNVFVHVDYLKELFKQETVRVTFINGIETTIVR